MAATESTTEQENAKISRWDKKFVRFALFAGTLIAAIMVAGGIFGGGGLDIFWVFPVGLLAFTLTDIFQGLPTQVLIIAVWLPYLGLSLFGTLTKRRRVFVTVYVIFVILLIVNLGGLEVLLRIEEAVH
jgi:hypothetical protein